MGRTRPTQPTASDEAQDRPRQLRAAEESGRFHPLALQLYELMLLGDGATVAGIASKPNLRNLRFVRPRGSDSDHADGTNAAAVRDALAHESRHITEKLRERDRGGTDYGAAVRLLLALEPGEETWPLSTRRGWAAAELGKSVRALTKTRYPPSYPYTPSYELELIKALSERIVAREAAFTAVLATSELLADHATANPSWAPPWFVAVAEISEVIDWIEMHITWALMFYGDLDPFPPDLFDTDFMREQAVGARETSLFLLGLFWSRAEPPSEVEPLDHLDNRLFPHIVTEKTVSSYHAKFLPWRVAAIMPFTTAELEMLVGLVQNTEIPSMPAHPDAAPAFNHAFNLDHFGELMTRWYGWLGVITHVKADCRCNRCELYLTLWLYRSFLTKRWDHVRDSYMRDPIEFAFAKRGKYELECGLRKPSPVLTVTNRSGTL